MSELFSAGNGKVFLDKKDRLLMWVFTLVYTVFTLLNLGTVNFPQNTWYGEPGDSVIIDLGGQKNVSCIWINSNIYSGQLQFTGEDGERLIIDQTYGEIFSWKRKNFETTTSFLRLDVTGGTVDINEIAVFDKNNDLLPVTVSDNAGELFDEQSTVPERPSYFNGMYFDEIYHARTAYEFLNTMNVYEWTHPPLGKSIIALGVMVFGMTPFGWRVMPALFGAAMLPIMFILAKRLFRRRDMAFLAMALFGLDTMHFAQTRISTVDVFIVFFILLMFLFMADYLRLDNEGRSLKETFVPLGLCGISFGLGVASKWTGLYAGAGLAVIFFTHLIRKGIAAKDKNSRKSFWKRTWLTICFCCVFFLAVPGLIYYLSYTPFYRYEESLRSAEGSLSFREKLNILIVQQQSMYSYHSNLTATHLCQSAWYEWPFTARSVWFYFSSVGDKISNISSFGNPAVWWTSSVGALCLITEAVFGRLKDDPSENKRTFWIILASIAANYLPWTLVPRCTFQYHFFPTVPFIILAAVFLVMRLEERGELPRKAKWIWLAAAGCFFLLLLPACSGIPMPRLYARFLEYVLPGGVLFHGTV